MEFIGSPVQLSSLLKKVSGTLKACEKPEIYSTRKVPDTFFNRLLGQGRMTPLLLQAMHMKALLLVRRFDDVGLSGVALVGIVDEALGEIRLIGIVRVRNI